MENIKEIVEDIVIYDKDLEVHLQRVTEVLERCKAAGITLHRKKAQFAQTSVEWCGYTLSKVGYFPREGLVDALTHFPRPVSRTDARSFCGLVQQFDRGLLPQHHCNDETDHGDNVDQVNLPVAAHPRGGFQESDRGATESQSAGAVQAWSQTDTGDRSWLRTLAGGTGRNEETFAVRLKDSQ